MPNRWGASIVRKRTSPFRAPKTVVLVAALPVFSLALSSGGSKAVLAGEPPPDREPNTEVAGVPFAGGDSDIGWGLGMVVDVTHWDTERRGERSPYAWRIDASLFATLQLSPVGFVYQDHWAKLTLPELAGGRLRLELRAAFTRESNVRYYGLGNAAPATSPGGSSDPNSPYYQYERTHPQASVLARLHATEHFYLLAGEGYVQSWTQIAPVSKLAADLLHGSPTVRALLGGTGEGGVNLLTLGVAFDDRDDEVVPRRGSFQEGLVRVSPSWGRALPYAYAEAQIGASGFVSLGRHVVLGQRVLGDLLVGQPPFWQMANYDDTPAIGGVSGVRGVPAQRYYGKIKVLESTEARFDVWRFNLFSRHWLLTTAVFFDAGRVWADWNSNPSLDGTGLGLKWGVGGGLRLHQGKGFVVRGDIAWSPDALPIGAYFAAGEAF